MDALSMHEDVDYELPYVERDAIKRPPNAFMLYRRVKSKELKTQPGESGGKAMPEAALSKIIGVMWRQESAEVQGRYYALAEEAKLEHMEKHPEWKFKTRTKKGKAKAAAERTRKAHSPPRATHADPFTGFSPAYLPPGQFFLPSMSSSAASTPPLSWSPYPQGSSGPITPSSGLMESEHAPFNMVELEQRASQDSLEIPAHPYIASHTTYGYAANTGFASSDPQLQPFFSSGRNTMGLAMSSASHPWAAHNADDVSNRPRKRARLAPTSRQPQVWSDAVPERFVTQSQHPSEQSFSWNAAFAPLDSGFCDFSTVLQRAPGPSTSVGSCIQLQAPPPILAEAFTSSSRASYITEQTGLHVQPVSHEAATPGLASFSHYGPTASEVSHAHYSPSTVACDFIAGPQPPPSSTLEAHGPPLSDFAPCDAPAVLHSHQRAGATLPQSPASSHGDNVSSSPQVEVGPLTDAPAAVPRTFTRPLQVVDVSPPADVSDEHGPAGVEADGVWQTGQCAFDSDEARSWFNFTEC